MCNWSGRFELPRIPQTLASRWNGAARTPPAHVTRSAVAPGKVVEHFGVVEDVEPSAVAGRVDWTADALAFEQLEDALGHSVVVALSRRCRGGNQVWSRGKSCRSWPVNWLPWSECTVADSFGVLPIQAIGAFVQGCKIRSMSEESLAQRGQPRNPLHGVTLEAMLQALVAHFGWPGLAEKMPVRCFCLQPGIASSLKFLRKTPWAREKAESLYLFMLREQRRESR